MCGIIGYIGNASAVPKMIEGLSVLEYRGYDSVGIAAHTKEGIDVVKCRGRVDTLQKKLASAPLPNAKCAIGHTRWATHGSPSDINAHPHRIGRTVLVHNGIIENAEALRTELSARGVSFLSDTDTEVAAAVIDECYRENADPIHAISCAVSRMSGSFAFGILFEDRQDEVYATRRGSPLILAKGEDGYYLASDMTAVLSFAKDFYSLQEGEIARISPTEAACISLNGDCLSIGWQRTGMSAETAKKGGYPHFMLKEICEQPQALQACLLPRIRDGSPSFSSDEIGDFLQADIRRIHLVACGSAMHACLISGQLFGTLAKIPAEVFIASEYRYRPPITEEGTAVILVSQSGETADTLAALRAAKARGQRTLAIVNARETSIAREADHCLYTHAGPEIAVATTKGYCTQVALLYLLALAFSKERGVLSDAEIGKETDALLREAPRAIESVLGKRTELQSMAERIADREDAFYIGRGIDYALSLEAALKLKEISYMHCEAYAAGELKHGTISLIEEGTPVIALSNEAELAEKTASNVSEVRSRGACVLLLCREDLTNAQTLADAVFRIPCTSYAASLFGTMAAIQLLAYEAAILRGCDVDRPRNLAKSVTVE